MANMNKRFRGQRIILSLLVAVTLPAAMIVGGYVYREDIAFQVHAWEYRHGTYWNRPWVHGSYYTISYVKDYLVEHERHKAMTEKDVLRLLGKPSTDTNTRYYGPYACTDCGPIGTNADYCLWYSENGPPDHWLGDEDCAVYFNIRNGRVVMFAYIE